MSHLYYVGVLLFIALCGVGVNIAFKNNFLKLWRVFLATDLMVLALYIAWDSWAIYKRNWYFDPGQILGSYFFFKVPVEEVLFFIIVPFTTVATYLALKRLTKWESGQQ